MADLAQSLMRTVTRAFYNPEHILVVEALLKHSTLEDKDLALVLGTQVKPLRKTCGRLREDGLVSVQVRAERRTDGTGGYYGGAPQPGKERLTNKDWYFINYHRAIDSIKFRLDQLRKHIESQGAPTAEKKDLRCLTKGCNSSYTELEALDNLDPNTGDFICKRCGSILQPVEEEERANENENMKRFNNQFEVIVSLLQKIDAAVVPENDFEAALLNHKPVERSDTHPGSRTEIVDNPSSNLQSVKGLEIRPEKIAVQVQDDEDVKRESVAAEARARKEKEARQNALPDWIAKSTIDGAVTAVGAKEEKERQARELDSAEFKDEDNEEKKPQAGDDAIMAAYWEDLKRAQEAEAQQNKEEDEEDDDDDEEDEFEDVDVSRALPSSGAGHANGTSSTGVNTPNMVESSNATDDERDGKRIKVEAKPAEDTPAQSDADDDEELAFEDV